MSKPLATACVFTIPYDEPTEDGQMAAWRFVVPAGTDRRKLKRLLRKIFEQLGIRDYHRAIREMGWSKLV